MSTLTDRYVWAVVRSLPQAQRATIDRELRDRIGEEILQVADSGVDRDSAEVDVITALGDPDRRAALYANKPTFLIGPARFFDYVRLLKVLAAVVLPVAFTAILLAEFLAEDPFIVAVGTALAATFTIAVQLGFWTTFAFAVYERASHYAVRPPSPWTPDDLSELPASHRVSIGEAIAGTVALVLFMVWVVWQQYISQYRDTDGNPIPFLNPELWSFWLPYVLVLVAAEVVFLFVSYARGRWTWTAAWVNVALNVALTTPAIALLLGGSLVNSAYFEAMNWPEEVDIGMLVPSLAAVIVLVVLWDTVDGFLRAWRGARLESVGLAAKAP